MRFLKALAGSAPSTGTPCLLALVSNERMRLSTRLFSLRFPAERLMSRRITGRGTKSSARRCFSAARPAKRLFCPE
jgi:hypothetical protein